MSSPTPDETGSDATATEYPAEIDGAVIKIAGVVVLGAIMSILDITVVSVALPTFARDFDATLATVAWTMTAYTLALATVIPLTGWAADRFGTKRLYLTALFLFTVGSVLCATASSVEMLVVFRVIQGLGGGMLMPLGMTILTRAAGPDRIGRLMALLGIPMLLGPIAGPILGGYLIDIASWHWIFLINLPIGVAALLYSNRILPKDEPSPTEPFDFMGMLLLSPGLALFLFGVSSIAEGGEGASFGPRVWVSSLAGVLLIAAFVAHALRTPQPLIDLRLFRNRRLTIATLSMFVFVVAFMGAGLLFPSYFLQVRGETTLMAGLLIAPQGIGAMITMPIAGILADKVPIGRTVPVALVVMAAGFFAFTQVSADTSYWILCGSLFVMGLGMGGTMMPIMTSALQSLTHHEVARGSTIVNIVQQIGGSIGTAVLSVVLTNQLTGTPPAGETNPLEFMADGFGATFMVAFVLVLLALIPVAFLPRKKIESPMLDDVDGATPPPMMMH